MSPPTEVIDAVAAGATIKSIQSGTILLEGANKTNTANITEIDFDKSFVIYLGQTDEVQSGASHFDSTMCYLELIDSTTVRATREASVSDTSPLVSFIVIEFESGINLIQRGVKTPAHEGDSDFTVTEVDLAKAFLVSSYYIAESNSHQLPSIRIKNSTTLTVRLYHFNYAYGRVAWQLIEFE